MAPKKTKSIPTWGSFLIATFFVVIVAAVIILFRGPDFALALIKLFPLIIGGTLFYFLPSFIGNRCTRRNAIFFANLLLGWTGIGWIIVLI